MGKIEVKKEFDYGGNTLERGKRYDVPDKVEQRAKEQGYAISVDEEEEQMKIEPKEEEGLKIEEKNDGPEIKARNSNANDIIQQMKEDIEKPPATKWNPTQDTDKEPEEHPELVGEIVRKGTSQEHDTEFVSIREEDGTTRMVFAHKALESAIENAEVGDFMAVKWTGWKTSEESGQDYLTYRYELRDTNGIKKESG